MLRWMTAALLLAAWAPVALAGTAAGDAALKAAMKSFFVVVPADAATGKPVAEVRGNADGTDKRTVVVAFIDAADAAAEMKAAGLSTSSEGRLVNGAELVGLTDGEVVWRTSKSNADIVNTAPTVPPVFYITNAAGESLTQTINGQEKVLFYLDAVAADEARVAIQNGLSAARKPATLVRLATLGWDETPETSRAAFEGAISGLAAAGVRILDASNDAEVAALEATLRGIEGWSMDLLAWEARWPLAAYRAHGPEMVGARIHDLLKRAEGMTPATYMAAVAARQALRDRVAAFAGRVDGFVMLA